MGCTKIYLLQAFIKVLVTLDNLSATEYTTNMHQRIIKIVQLANHKSHIYGLDEFVDKTIKDRV